MAGHVYLTAARRVLRYFAGSNGRGVVGRGVWRGDGMLAGDTWGCSFKGIKMDVLRAGSTKFKIARLGWTAALVTSKMVGGLRLEKR